MLEDILQPIGPPPPESTRLWDKIVDNLSSNPIFSGGAGLAAVGIGLTIVKRLGVITSAQIRRHCVRSLELTNENP